MTHVCFFSSGAASWLAAKRVAQQHGTAGLYLVFADTGIEDEDNYRFLQEAADNVGGKLVWLKDGRTPWDVFFEKRFVNHRQANCSIELKVKPCEEWIKSMEFDPNSTTLYFGISFEEIHRLEAIARNWQPFKVDAPLCWDEFGWADRQTIMKALEDEGLNRPRLYDLGFAHANCGGFCPKAGQRHFKRLLEKLPERYKHHEQREQEFRQFLGRGDIGLIRSGNKKMSLSEFRQQIESMPTQLTIDGLEGGCGCFLEQTGE